MVEFFQNILEAIYGWTQSYGIAVIIFTISIRAILTPFEISSRKGMRKMAAIQPKLTEIQKKYANDKQKLQQKQSELMQKEHYNPLSGCLPLLLQWPILFIMFYAMRNVANEATVRIALDILQGNTPVYEGFLWVRNIFMPDSPFATIAPSETMLISATEATWQKIIGTLSQPQLDTVLASIRGAVESAQGLELSQILDFSSSKALQATVQTYIMPALQSLPVYQAQVATVPGWNIPVLGLFTITLYQNFNGLLILPLLAGVTQVLMTKLNPATQTQPTGNNAQQSNSMNAFMKWFFPLFSVFICLSSNAGFALYWVTINIFATGQSIVINKYLDSKDQRAALTAGDGKGSVK